MKAVNAWGAVYFGASGATPEGLYTCMIRTSSKEKFSPMEQHLFPFSWTFEATEGQLSDGIFLHSPLVMLDAFEYTLHLHTNFRQTGHFALIEIQ